MVKKRSRKMWLIGGAFFALAALGVTGFVVMSRPKNEIDSSRLAAVERGNITRSVVATGKVEPIAKVEIKAKANGIIKELKVQTGDFVHPGQVQAELDKENLEARVRETKAALLGAESNLKAAHAQLEKNKVEAEGPDVPFTKRNFERSEKLLKEGVLPQQSYDDTRSAYEQAVNRQNVAGAQRNGSVEFPAPTQPKGKEKKAIKIGISNGTRTEVLAGLSEGQKVILQ